MKAVNSTIKNKKLLARESFPFKWPYFCYRDLPAEITQDLRILPLDDMVFHNQSTSSIAKCFSKDKNCRPNKVEQLQDEKGDTIHNVHVDVHYDAYSVISSAHLRPNNVVLLISRSRPVMNWLLPDHYTFYYKDSFYWHFWSVNPLFSLELAQMYGLSRIRSEYLGIIHKQQIHSFLDYQDFRYDVGETISIFETFASGIKPRNNDDEDMVWDDEMQEYVSPPVDESFKNIICENFNKDVVIGNWPSVSRHIVKFDVNLSDAPTGTSRYDAIENLFIKDKQGYSDVKWWSCVDSVGKLLDMVFIGDACINKWMPNFIEIMMPYTQLPFYELCYLLVNTNRKGYHGKRIQNILNYEGLVFLKELTMSSGVIQNEILKVIFGEIVPKLKEIVINAEGSRFTSCYDVSPSHNEIINLTGVNLLAIRKCLAQRRMKPSKKMAEYIAKTSTTKQLIVSDKQMMDLFAKVMRESEAQDIKLIMTTPLKLCRFLPTTQPTVPHHYRGITDPMVYSDLECIGDGLANALSTGSLFITKGNKKLLMSSLNQLVKSAIELEGMPRDNLLSAVNLISSIILDFHVVKECSDKYFSMISSLCFKLHSNLPEPLIKNIEYDMSYEPEDSYFMSQTHDSVDEDEKKHEYD